MEIKRRTTARKAITEEILARDYNGGPVLLEELRWKVLRASYGPEFTEMTDAKRKSYARTVREHFPSLIEKRVRIDGFTPVGLLARAAVYRIRSLRQLDQFLQSDDPCILCRYRTDIGVDEPRYRTGYVIPQHHAAAFRFFAKRPERIWYEEIEEAPGVFIPATHRVCMIAAPPVDWSRKRIASVPWKLFGHDALDEWFEVRPEDGLEAVKRNSD